MTIGKSVANQLHKLIHSTYLERLGKCSVFREDGVIKYNPPQKVEKLTPREERNCGLCVVLFAENGATLLVGIW